MKAHVVNSKRQTIIDAMTGKTLFFGIQDFYDKIVKSHCCFICGAEPESKKFNDEHIIPQWVLRRFNLHNEYITLTNGQNFKYGQYTVPCCVECNSELNDSFEKPLKHLFDKEYHEISRELNTNPDLFNLVFHWLCLIFLKTHIKDKYFLREVDRRKASGFIGDDHNWSDMHHVHVMARAHHTGAVVQNNVYGSLLVLPILRTGPVEEFDYMDNAGGFSIYLRLGDTCMIAVLNDASASYSAYHHVFNKISGPVTPLQSREIFARMTHINFNLKVRPIFSSGLNGKGYEVNLSSRPEEIEIVTPEEGGTSYGELFFIYSQPLIPDDVHNRDDLLRCIKEGRYSFLLDSNGEFIQHPGYEGPVDRKWL